MSELTKITTSNTDFPETYQREKMGMEVGTVDYSRHNSEYGRSENNYQPTINNSVKLDLDRVGESLSNQTTFFLIAMGIEAIVCLMIGVVIGLLL